MSKNSKKLFKLFGFVVKQNGLLKKIKKMASKGEFKLIDEITSPLLVKFGKFCIDLTESDVEVIGLENVPSDRSVVYIANHQSVMDIPLMLGCIPYQKGFIAKKEILKIPRISTWMKFLHCIFMDRNSMKESLKAINEGVEMVKSGYSMVIFPEGTRSRGGPVKPFKQGSFKLAFNSEAPIIPVSIDGSWHVFEETGKIQSSKIRLVIHPAIETKGIEKNARAKIVTETQSVIESALTNLSFKDASAT